MSPDGELTFLVFGRPTLFVQSVQLAQHLAPCACVTPVDDRNGDAGCKARINKGAHHRSTSVGKSQETALKRGIWLSPRRRSYFASARSLACCYSARGLLRSGGIWHEPMFAGSVMASRLRKAVGAGSQPASLNRRRASSQSRLKRAQERAGLSYRHRIEKRTGTVISSGSGNPGGSAGSGCARRTRARLSSSRASLPELLTSVARST